MSENNPLVFVEVESRETTNPIEQAVKAISFGGTVVDQLVDDNDVEVHIAVTNSVKTALRWIKETEHTTIVVFHLPNEEAEAVAFASRFPDRVRAMSVLGGGVDDQAAFVPSLLALIAEKAKEME